MAKFDLESFEDYFVSLLQDGTNGLNAKLAEIDSEKGDFTLDTFDNAQYVDDFNEKVINYDDFIFYGFFDIKTPESGGQGDSLEVEMFFSVFIIDTEGGNTARKKVLRYSRAIKEVIRENANYARISDVSIDQIAPVSMQANADSNWYKAGGVQITGTIA